MVILQKDTYGLKSIKMGQKKQFSGIKVNKVYTLARFYADKGLPIRASISNGVLTVTGLDPQNPPGKREQTRWTTEMDELLRDMRRQNIPFSFCAEVISREVERNITRMACISRLQTLKGKRR